MGFYSTTLEQEKPHQKTSDCAQKTASGKFFTSNRNRTYQIDRNPLETQQDKLTTTRETASGVFFYKYRHYSAELGRWLGRDPLGDESFLLAHAKECNKGMKCAQKRKVGLRKLRYESWGNLYMFVDNNPTGNVDEYGLLGGFVYGRYCGWSSRGPGKPIDDVDAACQAHDKCLATWSAVFKGKCCNCKFAKAILFSGCIGTPNLIKCMAARAAIGTAANYACLINPFL